MQIIWQRLQEKFAHKNVLINVMFVQDIIGEEWKVTYDNFSWLFENNNFRENKDFLGEDILQIEHLCKNYIADVGWYPSFDLSGSFKIVLIKNKNWHSPLLEYATVDLKEIIQKISEFTHASNRLDW